MYNKMNKKHSSVAARIGVMILIIAMIIPNVSVAKVYASGQITYGSIEDCDFNNFANWKSGCYSWTDGSYMTNDQRLCMSDYKTFSNTTYSVEISDNSYKMLVREMDSNLKMINTVTLGNGGEYAPSNAAVYLAVGIYKTDNEASMSYKTYETLFASGFYARLMPIGEKLGAIEAVESTEEIEEIPAGTEEAVIETIPEENEVVNGVATGSTLIDDCDMTDFNNWISGCYSWTDGTFTSYAQRLCLNDYKTFAANKYNVEISDSVYNVSQQIIIPTYCNFTAD